MIEVTGLTADRAVELLQKAGIEPNIAVTQPLRGARNVGSLRVIRWDEASRTLLCARFIDTVSEDTEIGTR